MTIADLGTNVAASLRARLPGVRLVAVFGSQARGDAKVASDVDVAVYAGAPIDPGTLAGARADLERTLLRDVHLVDLAAASTVMRHEVMRTGEVVFRTPDADVDAFLDFVLRDYVRLEEDRAGILRDVHARGRIHGR